jgi:DNA modification methylase
MFSKKNGTNFMTISSVAEKNLDLLLGRYAHNNKAIPVNFRKMLAGECFTDSFTHSLHPYPAKLLVHIPYFFLRNSILSKLNDSVLDIFSGSGTVLLEAIVSGKRAYGVDCNPLARFISNVKTTPLSPDKLFAEKESILAKIPIKATSSNPDVWNLDYWFYPHTIKNLKCIRDTILSVETPEIRDFFILSFSKLVKQVSLADPRLAVPIKLKTKQYPENHWLHIKTEQHIKHLKSLNHTNIVQEFENILVSNIKRMSDLWTYKKQYKKAEIISDNARNLLPSDCKKRGFAGLKDNSIQLVITSPPYPGAQKYIRSSFLHIGWLDMEPSQNLGLLKSITIGREELRKVDYEKLVKVGIPRADKKLAELFKFSPVRSAIAAIYLQEMREVVGEIYRVLKPGGFVVLIASNNEICKNVFETQSFLRDLFLQYGFKDRLRLIDDIKSRGLMTKRNKTAGIISREWVHLLEK